MLNLLSILVGIIALPLMLIALIPLLGWLNYLVIPIAVVGLALGALSDSTSGRNLNIVVAGVGASGVACSKIIMNAGARNIIGVDPREVDHIRFAAERGHASEIESDIIVDWGLGDERPFFVVEFFNVIVKVWNQNFARFSVLKLRQQTDKHIEGIIHTATECP